MSTIPGAGLVGAIALREAARGDLRQTIELVRAAIDRQVNGASPVGGERKWFDLEAVFPDSAVISLDGRTFRYAYAIEGTTVTLQAPVEVQETYVPLTEAADVSGALREAADAGGFVWDAVLIRAGLSANGRYYPAAVLREAAALFDGRPVFAKGDREHLAGDGKDVRNLVGYVTDVKFVEGAGADQGELQGRVTLLAAAGALPEVIREAWARGKRDLVGLSIDASGRAKTAKRGGRTIREAIAITRVDSVDLIVEPGAGGALVRLVEAANPDHMEDSDMSLKERMLEAIRAKNPTRAAAIDLAAISDDELETAYREALAPPEPKEPAGPGYATLEDIRMIEARAHARVAISGAKLPQAAKDKLAADFAGRKSFVPADVDSAIKAEGEYLARFTESGKVRMAGLDVEITEPRHKVVADMLDAFFDQTHKEHRSVQSFRECYREITGDIRVTGRLQDCDAVRLREALGEAAFRESIDSSTFSNVLGSAITRRMLADYRTEDQYGVWRALADVVPVGDFRTQERTRYGGYGDLPAVAQGDPYTALTSPSDEKATYAVGKYGGTEDMTLEAIKNDDVGALRRVPVKLSRAAKRTLAKFVLDFIRTNPTLYDSVAWFHASHGNLGSSALDATSLAAGRLAMLKQTEAGSSDRLGIGPRNLWVPPDLETTAVDLFARSTNLDKTMVQSLALNVIPVWYWTDANDWALTADKADIVSVEVGFLDGNEEPELFVQDAPTVGSMFSHDKLTYKIRHVYGGVVTDYRGGYKAVVA